MVILDGGLLFEATLYM